MMNHSLFMERLQDEIEIEPPSHELQNYIEIGFLSLCFAVGAPLNLYSFYRTLLAYWSQKTPMLFLKLHLNIGDLLIIFGFSLSQVIWLSTYQWKGGIVLCKAVKFEHNFSFALSAYIIVAIAIERAEAAKRLQSINLNAAGLKLAKALSIASWIMAGLMSLPQLWTFTVVEPFPGWQQCVSVLRLEGYNRQNSRSLHFLRQFLEYGHLLTIFWIPFGLIIVCYVLLIIRIHSEYCKHSRASALNLDEQISPLRRIKSRHCDCKAEKQTVTEQNTPILQSELTTNNQQPKPKISRARYVLYESFVAITLSRARNKSLRTAAAIILLFMVCWFPYSVIAIFNLQNYGVFVIERLIVVNALLNPLIYGIRV